MNAEDSQRYFTAAYVPLKTLVVSWVGVILLAVAAYTVTASAPSLGDIRWHDAARFGASMWMLGLGAPFKFAEGTITLLPLGLTWLIARAIYRDLLRNALHRWDEIAVAAVSAVFTSALLGLVAMPGTMRPLGSLLTGIGVVVLGILARLRAMGSANARVERVLGAWDVFRPILKALFFASLLGLLAALIINRSAVGEINGYYVLGASGTAMLAGAQFVYLPTFTIWTASFLTGGGFVVGEGTLFSPFGVRTEPLPAIPVLGALPGPEVHLWWLPILIGVAALVWGAARSSRFATLRDAGLAALSIAGLALAIGAAMGLLAGGFTGGGIGPGRMANVGTHALETALGMCVTIGLTFGSGLVLPIIARRVRENNRLSDAPEVVVQREAPEAAGVSPSDAEARTVSDPSAESPARASSPARATTSSPALAASAPSAVTPDNSGESRTKR